MNDPIVSFYSRVKATVAHSEHLSEIVLRIKNGAYSEAVAEVRAQATKAAARLIKEARLPAFAPSGTFVGGHKNDKLGHHSGVICADFDELGDRAEVVRNQLQTDPHCLCVFRSPYDGVKALFLCDPNREHLDSWRAVAARCKTLYGLELDPQTKDVARLCFVSHDPDAFIATGPVSVIPYPAAEQLAASQSQAHATLGPPPGAPASQLTRADVEELVAAIPPSPKYDPWLRVIAAVGNTLPEHDAIAVLQNWSPAESGVSYEAKLASRLTTIGVGTLVFMAKANGWKPSPAFKARMSQHELKEVDRLTVMQKVLAREFGVGPPPAVPVPRFLANGVGFATPGNIVNIQAQAKTGKTAFIGAMIAATIVASNSTTGTDCLGVTAAEPGGRVVLHFDTEQSLYHHHRVLQGALSRGGVSEKPAWLRSFGLAGLKHTEIMAAVRELCEKEGAAPGLFAVFIDGIADLISSVNEEAEANGIIAELQELAIRYDCVFVVVIHENPAQTTGKARGHLGSDLERKAETNIRLKKDEDVTVVFAEKTRGAPIIEKFGPRFTWSAEKAMFITAPSGPGAAAVEALEELRDLAQECLGGVPQHALKYAPLIESIMQARGCALATAQRRIKAMKKAGVIRLDTAAIYVLVPVGA